MLPGPEPIGGLLVHEETQIAKGAVKPRSRAHTQADDGTRDRLREALRAHDDLTRANLFEAAAILIRMPDAPAVLRTVVLRELGELVRTVPHFAIQRDALKLMVGIRGPAVRDTLVGLAVSNAMTADIRVMVFTALREVGVEADLAAGVVEDSDVSRTPTLAVEAAWLLASNAAAPGAVKMLLDAARNEPFEVSARTRLRACCEKVDLPGLADGLLALLSDPALPRGVLSSIAHLVVIASPPPRTADVVALLVDSTVNALVRRDLAEVVGQIDHPAVAHALVDLIKRPKLHAGVRARLALTLGTLSKLEITDSIVELLPDRSLDEGVRSRLASTLGHLQPVDIGHRLIALIKEESLDLPVRRALARALSSFDSPDLLPHVRGLLAQAGLDTGLKARLAQALVKLGGADAAIGALVSLAHDDAFEPRIRARIVRELAEIDHPEVPDALRTLLHGHPGDAATSVWGRELIVGLVAAGDTSVAGDVTRIMLDRTLSQDIRRRMVASLASVPPTGAPVLMELVLNPGLDARLRRSVAERLGAVATEAQTGALTAVVGGSGHDLAVRVDAACALGIAGNSLEAVDAIATLVRESSNRHGAAFDALMHVCARTGERVFAPSVGLPPISYL